MWGKKHLICENRFFLRNHFQASTALNFTVLNDRFSDKEKQLSRNLEFSAGFKTKRYEVVSSKKVKLFFLFTKIYICCLCICYIQIFTIILRDNS